MIFADQMITTGYFAMILPGLKFRPGHRGEQAGDIDRRVVEDYLLDLAERTHQRSAQKSISPATVARHYRSLQQLFRWLELEEEIEQSPFVKMSPPAVP
jgi:site-specific recombinase XerD